MSEGHAEHALFYSKGGSQIYTGGVAPSNGLGANGDFYVNTTNGDYYKKLTGAWALQGNLTGPVGPTGPTGPAGGFGTTYLHTLSGGEATAKAYQLSPVPPTPSNVVFSVFGAPDQFYGIDYTVSGGGLLSWSGLGLDGVLSSGDQVAARY